MADIIRGYSAEGGNISVELSQYALESPAETVAEAWAEYLNNEKPRDLRKKLEIMIEFKYKVEFGDE